MAHLDQTADAAEAQFRYWAFISYSQRDARWAQWLHRELETYRVPRPLIGRRVDGRAIPRRLLPIFRDRDELPSTGDLTGTIREALAASHALIVICSPYAAASPWVNEEVRTFKALGRAERIFPLIVDGEPYAADHPALGLPECFPPALRFAVAPDGTVTEIRSDPLAADAREGKDGRSNACLKLIAGMLAVGFDDLRRRELLRQRQRRSIGAGAALAAGLAMAAAYLGLADGDINVPRAAAIRLLLDHHGASIFRPIASHDEVVRTASQARTRLRARLVGALAPAGKLNLSQDFTASIWTLGQIAAALYRDPDAAGDELRFLAPMIDRILQDDFLLTENGAPIGWPGDGPLPRVETALWVMMALTHGVKREDAEAVRARYLGHLETVQQIAESYYSARDGGWNAAMQSEHEDHSYYSSALALHALLELNSAHLCWRGSCERLDAMIRDASQWLIRTFVDERRGAGWRRTVSDTDAPDPDLSLIVYSALGRAAVPLPDNIQIAAVRQLAALRFRPYHPAYHDIRQWVTFASRGKQESVSLPTEMLWYPWATEALVQWLRYADRHRFPPETRRALERSLGHVLVADSEDMVDDMSRAAVFSLAETAYGIAGVR